MSRSELKLYRRLWMRAARGQAWDTSPPHRGRRWENGKLLGSSRAGRPRIPGGPAASLARHAWRARLKYRLRPRCFSCAAKQGLRLIERNVAGPNGREVPRKVLWCGKC